MTNRGCVRIDEVMYPIVDFELAAASIIVRARANGPLPAASGPVRLLTARGEPVTEWVTDECIFSMAEVPTGSFGEVTVTLNLQDARSAGSRDLAWFGSKV